MLSDVALYNRPYITFYQLSVLCIFVYLGTFVDIAIFNNRGFLYCTVYGF